MNLRLAAAALSTVAGLSLTACGTSASTTPTTSPTTSSTMATAGGMGAFAGLNGKHVAGTAAIKGMAVELSGFSSDQGPDLHVYLTNGTDEAAVTAGKEIGKVTYGATESFPISAAEESGYTYVVIHCDKAKAVFGAAKLS